MEDNIVIRVGKWFLHFIRKDLQVIGDGRIALAASAILLLLATESTSMVPRELSEEGWWFKVHQTYGSHMLMMSIMTTLMIISLITKKKTFPYERAMLLLSIIFMAINGVISYRWGIKYNLSVF